VSITPAFRVISPQPILLAALVLAGTQSIWAGPCPTLLTLRDPGLVAEEFSWLEASFPGRFGAAVAPGYAASDFEALAADFESRTAVFDSKLRRLLHNLSRRGPLEGDAAIGAWSDAPSPLLSAGNSRRAIRRAAEIGVGLVYPGGESQARLAEMTDLYRTCGGTGPVVWIKSIRLGPPSQLDTSVFRKAAAPGMRLAQGFEDGPTVGEPDAVGEQLLDGLRKVGATALNVRFHQPGRGKNDALAQLQRFAQEVLPGLRAGWTIEPAQLESGV
jgi:alkanesulfonate monooxygenase SsuD/methylene tetrahydromethanopterin reductase-like flavin-dependent oxidoreductase (luciferase family)